MTLTEMRKLLRLINKLIGELNSMREQLTKDIAERSK